MANSKLIVVEGAQGAGKTTITDYLRNSVKYTNLYRLCGTSDSSISGLKKAEEMYIDLIDYIKKLENKSINLLFDRTFFTEENYCRLGLKEYSFTEVYNKLLDEFSKLDFDIYYITLYLSDESLYEKRLQREGKVEPKYAKFNVSNSIKQQNTYLEMSKEIKEKINLCNRQLRVLDYKEKIGNLTDYSMKILKDFVRVKYKGKIQRHIFEMADFTINPEKFNREYPIILSTTHSIKNCFKSNYKFDYIIMDEASQVDLITGVLAMSVAKNAVIVGDLKQLPNVITNQDVAKIERLSKKYNVEDCYNYLQNSFLSSVSKTIKGAPDTMLKEHYRCHPKIIGFCNKKFYDNQLIIMTEDNGEKDVLKAYVTVEGNHARGHYNQRQIDVIEQEVLPELEEKVSFEDIGIISPYREQKQNLHKYIDNIQVDTVHKFQGREKDAIVITTVDNEISEFVDDPKMLNVAITRAKRYLRVVVSDNKENEGTNLDDLIKYIQYNNFEVKKSKIKSIYDLLYKQNMEQRLKYLKGKKRISEYDSENITYNFIMDLIKEKNFNNLDVAVHVPLSDVLEELEKLTPDEWKFVNKTWTHIDFVIFNKMDKKTVVAVEVDGYFYHKEGTMQERRDKVKDKILEKYEIPLVRLGTMKSDERKMLEQNLEMVFSKSKN